MQLPFSDLRAALLFDSIVAILEEHPGGIREYDLLCKLEEKDLLPDGRDGTLAFEYNPDTGGSDEDFRTFREAAERLKKAGIF